MLRIGLLALACVFFISPAEARHRRIAAPVVQPFAWPNIFVLIRPKETQHRSRRFHARHRSRHVHIRHRHVVKSIVPLPRRRPAGVSLIGVVPKLAAKITEIVTTCGSEVVSTVRHTYVTGTHHISQHANGTAVDITRNPRCIYSMLRGWPGGYSTDYRRVRHVHISIGGREAGVRFVHGGHRRHYAHRHHRHRAAFRETPWLSPTPSPQQSSAE